MRFLQTLLALILVSFGVAATAFAQSAIAGVVKDSSGGVLPGVTVEASSPALIEGPRPALTDSSGQYKFDDLRPATSSMLSPPPGSRTMRHEAIPPPASFTATVNAELAVGALEEALTVTGEAPLVDTRSST